MLSTEQIILGQAICLGLVSLIFMALYYARLDSVVKLQTIAEDANDALKSAGFQVSDIDYIAYDRACGPPFSDDAEAAKLAIDIAKDCDADCQKLGSRWSHVYASMGTIMLILLLTTICVCVGAYKPVLRCIASCCLTCLCCAHFCTFIAVAVYRFND